MTTNTTNDDDLEWEEWDGTSPFIHHCIAGSTAGVAEHTLLYPVDTVKTHLQCAACPHSSSSRRIPKPTQIYSGSPPPAWRTPSSPTTMMGTMRHLMSQAASTTTNNNTSISGASRLWRGVQTMAVGCIPAHALYFSSYEATKLYFSKEGHLSNVGGMAAGAAAVVGHDVVMTPLDTIKQRLQLGHYEGMSSAFFKILQTEGTRGLYRSFPITLLTNIPYGMIMVSTNEALKRKFSSSQQLDLSTCLLSSSLAGMVAAALTTPLDRIKTFLQTQQLQPACDVGKCPKLSGPPLTLQQAVFTIFKQEGLAGFFKGLGPRVVTHTPAVAISWTTYETAKQWLASL